MRGHLQELALAQGGAGRHLKAPGGEIDESLPDCGDGGSA